MKWIVKRFKTFRIRNQDTLYYHTIARSGSDAAISSHAHKRDEIATLSLAMTWLNKNNFVILIHRLAEKNLNAGNERGQMLHYVQHDKWDNNQVSPSIRKIEVQKLSVIHQSSIISGQKKGDTN